MRRGALLKVDQNIGMSPTSVGGGENALGNCEANGGFCGPGSVKLDGLFVVLIWPCGGSSGLPKVAALAAAAAVATVPAAAAASMPRRDTGSMHMPPRERPNPNPMAHFNDIRPSRAVRTAGPFTSLKAASAPLLRVLSTLYCAAKRGLNGPRFAFRNRDEPSQRRHHRPRRPRQDHAGRPTPAAIRCVS